MPLNPSGQTPDQLAAGQQPLGVGVGREGRATLAGQLPDHRGLEDDVGAQHPQVPLRRVLVVHGDLGHQAVDGHRARVVGDDQRAADGGDVVDAADLDPEPLPVERAQRGKQHVVGQVGVVAELVDGVVALQTAPQEGQQGRGVPLQAARLDAGLAIGLGASSSARFGVGLGLVLGLGTEVDRDHPAGHQCVPTRVRTPGSPPPRCSRAKSSNASRVVNAGSSPSTARIRVVSRPRP